MNEFDGVTSVCLSDSDDECSTGEGMTLRWRGVIRTSGRIAVMNVRNEILLEAPARSDAEVVVWSNSLAEPDALCICLL